MSTPSLPQRADDAGDRKEELSRQAAPYQYSYDEFSGIAMAAEVPKQDGPDLAWIATLGEVLSEALLNAAKVEKTLEREVPEHPRHRELLEVVKDFESGGLKAALGEIQAFVEGKDSRGTPVDSLDRYESLFQSIELPDIAATWMSDESFARMRVAGPNPMVMRRAPEIPTHFAVSEAVFERALAALRGQGHNMGEDSLAKALAEGRLFLCDYKAFVGVQGGSFPHSQKYVHPAMALFASSAGDRKLLPICIQMGQTPDTPMYTPADGEAWLMARTAMTVADGNLHQAVAHLGTTHLVTSPFLLAAQRNLAPTHPLQRLLAVHHEGTLYINDQANKALMAPGQGVDAVMAGSIETSRAVSIKSVQDWDFSRASITCDIAERGLDDRDTLPDFPYRDDGLLLWGAIRDWVEAFVRTYYHSNADVVGDYELQAFWREAGSREGGRIKGIPPMLTVHALIEGITLLIFTPSVQHAAVNFPQVDLMSYVPNFPLAGFSDGPSAKQQTREDLLQLMPPLDIAQYQGLLGHLLGSVHHTKLGDYSVRLFGHFIGDARLDKPLDRFQDRLTQVTELIEVRNQQRTPYRYLLPERIPQSINI